jgi:hypothetical protein
MNAVTNDNEMDWEDVIFGVTLFMVYQLITHWHDKNKKRNS